MLKLDFSVAEFDINNKHLKRLNLNLLYALNAILDSNSLTEAGRMIRLSQPAVSVAFRKLKHQFQDELIIYLAGDRILTPLAQQLKPRVKKLLSELDETFNYQIHFDPKTSKRTFRLAASESLATMLLGRMAPQMLVEAPYIDIEILSVNNMTQSEIFEIGVDLVIVHQNFLDVQFPSEMLMLDQLSCMVWNEHPRIKNNINVNEYLESRHAVVSDPLLPFNELLSQRKIAATTNRYGNLPGLIIGTDLIVTASTWILQYYASIFQVKVLPFPIQEEQSKIYAQWAKFRESDPAHHWLMMNLNRFTATYRKAQMQISKIH